jgi:hypothetical protein
MMGAKLLAIGLLLSPVFFLTDASAQTPSPFHTSSPPNSTYVGQPPSYISPLPNGMPVQHTFGQSPVFGSPTPNGGYTLQRPGQQPTYINPQ